jgi:hypothetical protein
LKALFVHVPRCGGMSFYYFLEEIFGKENCKRFGDNASVSEFLKSSETNSEISCLSGHIPYHFFRDRNCNRTRFTISFMRDPESRELSCFSHVRDNNYADHLTIPSENQLTYWQHFSHDQDLHNIQTSYFSEDRQSKSAMNSILEDRICIFDINDIFVVADIIKSFVGVDNMPAHTNGSNRENLDLIDDGAAVIKEFCAEDKRLHNWVKANRQFFLNQLKIELWKSYLQKNIE